MRCILVYIKQYALCKYQPTRETYFGVGGGGGSFSCILYNIKFNKNLILIGPVIVLPHWSVWLSDIQCDRDVESSPSRFCYLLYVSESLSRVVNLSVHE